MDDGVATGMTMRAARRRVRRLGPSRVIAAAPVALREALAMLRSEVDAAVCLSAPRRFPSVGSFYRTFAQVGEEEAVSLPSEGTRS